MEPSVFLLWTGFFVAVLGPLAVWWYARNRSWSWEAAIGVQWIGFLMVLMGGRMYINDVWKKEVKEELIKELREILRRPPEDAKGRKE